MEDNKEVVEQPTNEPQQEQPQTQEQNNQPSVDTEVVFKELKKYIDIRINEVMDNFKREEPNKEQEENKEVETW